MGKGEIISGGDGGLYQVRLKYNRVSLDERLDLLDSKIAEQEQKIGKLPEGAERDRARLTLVALEMEKRTLRCVAGRSGN